ncbi:hypothetical protein O3L50_004113 [Salmonella enterica]|uniref:Uncharacterized protein n=1 Tax=Salmonella enterica subsp. enterica serovar Javiana TaxID=363569 RepID=A0A607KEQ5_SALET|nr:hypothetical protein [Salmonella enterica]EAR0120305.1 hypothetical protein [Salmonella enterica subsp. enterica serovar Javiana]EBF4797467.1 hypothetical protein [Salmonella enterica subsp. enterica]EDY0542499.1 hypothetical protein [Salmonella enterica subsp. enterica serovar Panama]EAN6962655.1 hypothetical protein [Salmonella enterica]
MENRKGNVMVAGKPGTGKTAISVEVMQTLLSARQRNGWQELRDCIQNDKENSGGEHHDNQQ